MGPKAQALGDRQTDRWNQSKLKRLALSQGLKISDLKLLFTQENINGKHTLIWWSFSLDFSGTFCPGESLMDSIPRAEEFVASFSASELLRLFPPL